MAWPLSAKVSLASNAAALTAMALAWAGIPAAPLLPYAAHKFLHIFGVVLFMGNLIAGPLWLWFAALQDEGRHYAFAARTLDDADIWLTTPGVQLTVWNGLYLVAALGGAQRVPWVAEAMAWLVLSSLLTLVWLLPMQVRLVRAAQGDEPAAARAALVRWSVGGMVVMLPFTAVAWLMVAKQPLWWR